MTDQKTNIRYGSRAGSTQSWPGLGRQEWLLSPPIKQLTEAAVRSELEVPLDSDDQPNRKNGST